MAGGHVNDGQARQYMRHRRNGHAVETAAKAGFSRAMGYRIEADARLPSAKRKRRGSRCPDPLGGLFEPVAVPRLERNPNCGRWRRRWAKGLREPRTRHGATMRCAGRRRRDNRRPGSDHRMSTTKWRLP